MKEVGKRNIIYELWLNGQRQKMEVSEDFVQMDLGELLMIYHKLAHPTLWQRLFGNALYREFALEDIGYILEELKFEFNKKRTRYF